MNEIAGSKKRESSVPEPVLQNLPENRSFSPPVRNQQRTLFLSSRKTRLCREAT